MNNLLERWGPSKRFLFFDRLLFGAATLSLLVSLASFRLPSLPIGLLSLFFPFCWAMWIACVFSAPPNKKLRLLTLWLILDITILAMLLSVTSSILREARHGPDGRELLYLFSWYPISFPAVFAIDPLRPTIEAMSEPLGQLFGRPASGDIAGWAYMSIAAAAQSIVFGICSKRGWLVVEEQHANHHIVDARNRDAAR